MAENDTRSRAKYGNRAKNSHMDSILYTYQIWVIMSLFSTKNNNIKTLKQHIYSSRLNLLYFYYYIKIFFKVKEVQRCYLSNFKSSK